MSGGRSDRSVYAHACKSSSSSRTRQMCHVASSLLSSKTERTTCLIRWCCTCVGGAEQRTGCGGGSRRSVMRADGRRCGDSASEAWKTAFSLRRCGRRDALCVFSELADRADDEVHVLEKGVRHQAREAHGQRRE